MELVNLVERIRGMTEEELRAIEDAVSARRRELGNLGGEARSSRGPVSYVVSQRPYADGWLQAEMRVHVRKDGGRTERGPYWYFRYHQQGRQRTLYLGKTDEPEAVLEAKRI
jgi:hypothetical protein